MSRGRTPYLSGSPSLRSKSVIFLFGLCFMIDRGYPLYSTHLPMVKAHALSTARLDGAGVARRRAVAYRLGAVLWLTLCSPLAHADFNAGVRAYQSGDLATAFEEFKKAADAGNARAQLNVGLFYDKGLVVEQNRVQAAEWYARAAAAGIAQAQFNLAALYFEGLGVEKDYATALDWYSRAAFGGSGDAQFNLSVMYQEGLGTQVNYVEAHAWLELAGRTLSDIPPGEAEGLRNKMTEEELSRAQKRYEEIRQMVRKDNTP